MKVLYGFRLQFDYEHEFDGLCCLAHSEEKAIEIIEEMMKITPKLHNYKLKKFDLKEGVIC